MYIYYKWVHPRVLYICVYVCVCVTQSVRLLFLDINYHLVAKCVYLLQVGASESSVYLCVCVCVCDSKCKATFFKPMTDGAFIFQKQWWLLPLYPCAFPPLTCITSSASEGQPVKHHPKPVKHHPILKPLITHIWQIRAIYLCYLYSLRINNRRHLDAGHPR